MSSSLWSNITGLKGCSLCYQIKSGSALIQSLSQWVSEWQGHRLSCSGQLITILWPRSYLGLRSADNSAMVTGFNRAWVGAAGVGGEGPGPGTEGTLQVGGALKKRENSNCVRTRRSKGGEATTGRTGAALLLLLFLLLLLLLLLLASTRPNCPQHSTHTKAAWQTNKQTHKQTNKQTNYKWV